ncbi:MAG: rRNA pseudouridine synthase [Deltaproteobacteria bacterium]|nr:rRNA pseudouridine synthase [Deltaproteobacteria bacterium]
MTAMRLQKYLSTAGVCSRRQGEKYMLEGRIRVNGKRVTELGTRVDPKLDQVEVDGKAVTLNQKPVYIALNKPKGYIASCKQQNDKTVLDLINIPQRVYPVGRLDKDSTGLLILTNDGRVHHRLLHPSFDHEKEYEVTVAQAIANGALNKMESGIILMGKKTRPATIKRIAANRFRIILKEGKNRQIRRMVRKVGSTVVDLKRIRFSNITLSGINDGQWRFLTETEEKDILQSLEPKTGE